ncbi:DUF4224 domain-containing protein [Dokdonella sp.]|uniref:DUF4224 domain-containing protein n=1 Tax=Dokdonella sp. TaxID=2291710 RepID=UPI002DD6B051|nr:DUF4224 domain-containing protein [Dokdonella sp.]
MFLNPDELETLTARKTKPAQRRQLLALGIHFAMRADGSIVVSKAHAESILGTQEKQEKSKKKPSPNWSALDVPA